MADPRVLPKDTPVGLYIYHDRDRVVFPKLKHPTLRGTCPKCGGRFGAHPEQHRCPRPAA